MKNRPRKVKIFDREVKIKNESEKNLFSIKLIVLKSMQNKENCNTQVVRSSKSK